MYPLHHLQLELTKLLAYCIKEIIAVNKITFFHKTPKASEKLISNFIFLSFMSFPLAELFPNLDKWFSSPIHLSRHLCGVKASCVFWLSDTVDPWF